MSVITLRHVTRRFSLLSFTFAQSSTYMYLRTAQTIWSTISLALLSASLSAVPSCYSFAIPLAFRSRLRLHPVCYLPYCLDSFTIGCFISLSVSHHARRQAAITPATPRVISPTCTVLFVLLPAPSVRGS